MATNIGLSSHRLLYELSPIILTNGITKDFPVPGLPIMAITEAANFPFSILSGSANLTLDNFFAHYQALTNSILIAQQVAKYPFANSTIAANSTMKVPKTVSMVMLCPVQNKLGWLEKAAIIRAFVYALEKHNSMGGTYIVATPSFIYTDCVMTGMHDISTQVTKQVQNAWQLDFEQPLVTQSDVDAILSSVSKAIEGLEKVSESVWGLPTVGATTSSALPALLPSAMPSVTAASAATSAPAWTVPSGTAFPL